ncbi:Diphthine--ammonia ligase [Ananas comosus]|uniref:Diphthine--ammonia ligase n=1 Tax=Ananas comosus TaxID=4615 RepID=A0A199VU69_ANACO|nr:Diphthine--ammonia ligase [Ananas comosus]
MKVVALVSGGKDSCFAMMRCIDYGHEIVALANLMPMDDSVDELDSYMYQTVGHQIIVSYAECMGLPLFRRRIRGTSRDQRLNYAITPGDEVEDLFILLNEVKQQIPSITAVSSGAIASDYQRLRVESVCSRLGLVSLAYLWKQDQTFLLTEMIRRGILAITVKVAAIGLSPAKHLGRELADLEVPLLELKERYGINVCGEGGEYETLTLDCPLFSNARIVLDKYDVVLHSADSIAPVGIIHPLAFHPEYKNENSSRSSSNDNVDSNGLHKVHEVEGDFVLPDIVKCQSSDLPSDAEKKLELCISNMGGELFSLGCWIQNPSRTSKGLQDDLASVLRRIELQLSENGFDWSNVLYVHLYISNMEGFALANEVYVKFITEKKCHLGVPSRSTIELPLLEVGLGSGYVEVLVAKEQSKRVLHVQSISSWAPSCIGPYSQATLFKEVLYMAGQLGLDPPTMMLSPGGATAELEQALINCEAVANCFNSFISSSTILFVIYCSSCLTSTERVEIQHKMAHYIQQEASNVHQTRRMPNPIFLYILAPDLPKGASVEIKPVLYVPENAEDEVQIRESRPASKISKQLNDSALQVYAISGKICTVLVSVTNDFVKKSCSETDVKSGNWHRSERNLQTMATFCVVFLNKILSENDFSWGDLINLRFYCTTNLFGSADTLDKIFTEAFAELSLVNNCIKIGEIPRYNLVPVLGSGRSASMDDIITCELFASKL